jgi:hypothetical protein
MPTANDFFPSRFLKAEELDADLQVTVRLVATEVLTGKSGKPDETKPVAYFDETEKGLILNKTNFAAIAKITGEEDSDNWKGKKITLTVIDVDAFGDIVKAIRVKENRSDPDVQKYWNMIADMRMTREEGLAHLKEYKGHFAEALSGLIGEKE